MSEDTGDPTLSDLDERALASVLDEIIPPSGDGGLPGAGELGLARIIRERAPDLGPVIADGLSALRDVSGRRGSEDFAALSAQDKLEALNELATTQPAFLPGLIFQTYVTYYQNARVVEALGLEARPPYPKGYEIEPGDFTLLDEVRQRPERYRSV